VSETLTTGRELTPHQTRGERRRSRLILAESGTRTVRNQLVVERQSEMIESMTMIMRLAAARQFEDAMNGLLIPEVSRNYELLNRMLTDHFRVQQVAESRLTQRLFAQIIRRIERLAWHPT